MEEAVVQMASEETFTHLIVAGASAGGIEALAAFVGGLPANFPAPIVIAQHLEPTEPLARDFGASYTSPRGKR